MTRILVPRSPAAPQQANVRHSLAPRLQKKLEVGAADDQYEREADRVAEQVTRGAAPPVSAAPAKVQRACACGGTCSSCREDEEKVRRSPSDNGPVGAEAPGSVHDALRSPGQPLDPATRAYFEPRFGHDFAHVRVHTDSQAAASARDVSAQAYTVGHDLVFAPGRYAPGTDQGNRLLAHELTHVVQQVPHLARKELTCGSGFSEGRGSIGPWVSGRPRPAGIGEEVYYITGTWKDGDDKNSYYQRTVDSWIRWRFGGVAPDVRAQIHKILPAERYEWFKDVTVADHKPGCQYRVYMATSTHNAISALVDRARAAKEAEKREEAAGGGDGGEGGGATGGADAPPGAAEGALKQGFKPSGSEYSVEGAAPSGATAKAFPARILGPDTQAVNGVGYFTMSLDYSIVGDRLAQVIDQFNYVDYHWERYDITPLVEKGLKAKAEEAYRKSLPAPEAEVGSFEGTGQRAGYAVEKLGREAKTSAHDLLNPVETAYSGTATEIVGNLIANKTNLQLLGVSAIATAGGQSLGALADLLGGKSQERELTFKKEGYYLIRCIARPAAQKTRVRAASVATKVVEVRKPEKLAKAALDEPEAEIAQTEFDLATATTPEEKAKQSAKLEQLKIFASGSALQLLQQRRRNLEEERKKATGRTAERLQEQVSKLDAQILRLQEELAEGEGEVLRPRLSLASEVTGQTYPLIVSLVPQPRPNNKGAYRYKLVDVTGKGTEDYLGAGATANQAAWNAIRSFAGKNEYGAGALAVRFPNAGDTKIEPAQDVIDNRARGPAVTRERLNDLVTVLVTLGLFVSGVGEVAAVLGAALAAERLYRRWSAGTLEPDGEAIADVIAVVGAVGMGAAALGKLKLVRSTKAFTIALESADEAALLAALKAIEDAASITEKINKANELIGHFGMLVGNVNLFDQFMTIQKQELDGTLNHAEARRMRFQMLTSALRDNAVPLHLIRGEKPAAKEKAAIPEKLPAGTPEKAPAGTPEKAPATPEKAPAEAKPVVEGAGQTADPSTLKPGDPQAVHLGPGLTGQEKVSASVRTPDRLHEVIILEDGRIIRCSRLCGEILAHYEPFLKEETDEARVSKATELKNRLEALNKRSKETQDPKERETIAGEAGAIDVELRKFAAERLGAELKIGTRAAESFLSLLDPIEVRALRDQVGANVFNFLASRKDPNVHRKVAEAFEATQGHPAAQKELVRLLEQVAKRRTQDARIIEGIQDLVTFYHSFIGLAGDPNTATQGPSPAAASALAGLSRQELRTRALKDPEAAAELILRYRNMDAAELFNIAQKEKDSLARYIYFQRNVLYERAEAGHGAFSVPQLFEVLRGDVLGERKRSGIGRVDPPESSGEEPVKGGTVGAGRTNIPGLADRSFIGQSPHAGGTPDPTYKPPSTLTSSQGHAEQNIAGKLKAAVTEAVAQGKLKPHELAGKKVWMLIEQEVCSVCGAGLADQTVAPGVLLQLSKDYPGLTIEIKNLRTSDLIIIRDGKRIN